MDLIGDRRGAGDGLGDDDEALGRLYQAPLGGGDGRGEVLLAQAIKTLPMGTAYAVWTGIGALGSVILGIVVFKEPATAARLFFAALLLIGIVGLKVTSH